MEAAKTVFAGSGVDAVLQREIDECVEAAEQLGTALSPWAALMSWIERFTDFVDSAGLFG